jgi:sugar/nucleoside kinase (ribokinase family)
MYPGGNSLNVSVHLRRLGNESTYLGNIGDDKMAGVIVRALQANDVDFSHCEFIEGGTTKHCNYEVINGERTFVNVELGDKWSGPMDLTEDKIEYLNGFDVIISNCNAKMQDEMKKISRLDKIYVYDFGEKDKYHVEEYLNLVCDNMDLAMFSFPHVSEEVIGEFARKIMAHGVVNVLVTMGSHGQYLINENGIVHGEVKYVEAVDTMGAGDSFLAAFVSETFRQGWKKGEVLSREKIEQSFDVASSYSRDNCLAGGGFGYEILL